MANGNGNNWIKNLGILGGFILAMLGVFSGTMLAVGQDRTQLKTNTRCIHDNKTGIEANQLAARNLEISQAAIIAQLDAVIKQGDKMDGKLDALLGIKK